MNELCHHSTTSSRRIWHCQCPSATNWPCQLVNKGLEKLILYLRSDPSHFNAENMRNSGENECPSSRAAFGVALKRDPIPLFPISPSLVVLEGTQQKTLEAVWCLKVFLAQSGTTHGPLSSFSKGVWEHLFPNWTNSPFVFSKVKLAVYKKTDLLL